MAARLTHNYAGFADQTAKPCVSKWHVRRKSDWGWRPYREGGGNSAVTVIRTTAAGFQRSVVAVGKPKRERRD